MEYFTRKCISGGLSGRQTRAAADAYAKYISGLGLSPALALLARLNLHDARIYAVTQNDRLKLRLRHGDLQRGYVSATLAFSQFAIAKKSLQLLRAAVLPSNVEILATEFKSLKDAYRFRLLLWPKGEVALTFKYIVITSRAVSSR